jgi:hypothetical protein
MASLFPPATVRVADGLLVIAAWFRQFGQYHLLQSLFDIFGSSWFRFILKQQHSNGCR